MKVIIVLSLILAVANAGVPGAPRSLEGDDLKTAKDLLTTTFAKLTTGDGPHYQVVNVKSASRQVVAGTLHKYVVDVSDGSVTEECIVEIWEQPWLDKNGTKVTIKSKDVVKLERTW